MKTTDTLLVSFDFTNGADKGVLVVGRKFKNQAVKIVNAFQGEEAKKLYNLLTDKRSDSSE